jgi:hypothetical protein
MLRTLTLTLAAFASLAAAAGTSRADCAADLPKAFQTTMARATLVGHRGDDKWVSYATGELNVSGAWLTGQLTQTFSDRFTPPPAGSLFSLQNFNVNNADKLTLYVSQAGQVWIYNNTWGGWTNFSGTCPSSGPLYGFPGDGEIMSISFTPQVPPR